MRSKRLVAIIITAVLALVSCSRDPNVAKRRYLESGNKYFDKGKYKEARIMYLNAKAKDQRWGPAYYKLGLTALKLGSMTEAVNAFRRAVELLPASEADHWDAVVKLSRDLPQRDAREILPGRSRGLLQATAEARPEFVTTATGSLAIWTSCGPTEQFKIASKDEGKALLDQSIAEYRKAEAIKPGQAGVVMQLARALAARNPIPRSGKALPQCLRKGQDVSIRLHRTLPAAHVPREARRRRAGVEAGSPEQS